MPQPGYVSQVLADAFLAGTPDVFGFHARASTCFAHKQRWLPGLCRRAFRTFGSSLLHRDRERLVAWINGDRGFRAAYEDGRLPAPIHVFLDAPKMAPRTGRLAACDLPALATPGDLASWLGVTAGELDWFADVRAMNPPQGPLSHYRYRWIEKSVGKRLVEIPKERLRRLQSKILRGILNGIPMHHAAHGFRRGRSCLSYARPHVGQAMVLRMDLQDFFVTPATPTTWRCRGMRPSGNAPPRSSGR
jgi:RNA-directed DNA polymerase